MSRVLLAWYWYHYLVRISLSLRVRIPASAVGRGGRRTLVRGGELSPSPKPSPWWAGAHGRMACVLPEIRLLGSHTRTCHGTCMEHAIGIGRHAAVGCPVREMGVRDGVLASKLLPGPSGSRPESVGPAGLRRWPPPRPALGPKRILVFFCRYFSAAGCCELLCIKIGGDASDHG